MNKFNILCGENNYEIFCHSIDIDANNYLNIEIDCESVGTFKSWDGFYQIFEEVEDEHEDTFDFREEMNKLYQGFAYKSPEQRDANLIKARANLVQAAKELQEAVDANS